jgi:hypothetical protein
MPAVLNRLIAVHDRTLDVRFRKAARVRGNFPNEQAALEVLYQVGRAA